MTPRALIIALTLFLTTAAAAQQKPNFRFMPGPKPGGGDVKITVDEGGTTELQKDEYSILQGGVTIEYQDIKLRADKVTYNFKTRDVVAEGNVVIDQGSTRLAATQAIYNLDSKTGTFFNANATMDPAMYFSGDRIEKVDEDTYRMTNGVFTSCDLDRPAWSFQVGNADVTLDDYARMSNISFRARDLPIFWLPRLIWPTKRERSQGLLIPRARFSDRFGARLENGYFIPFGESIDATVYADISSASYFGSGVDLRYVPNENIKIGDLNAYAVNNVERDTVEWKYHFRHAQENLPGGFRGVVDMQDYSDLQFFREYADDPNLHLASNIYSSAYLTKNRPTYSVNLLADRRDIDLRDRRQRSEQLPSLQYRMYPQQIARTPFYFSMESSASHLRTGAVIGGERTIDADYMRTDVFPTVSMRLRTPQWLSVKPEVSLRQTYYTASRDPETGEVIDDESVSRSYAQGQVEMVGPSFSRIYNRAAGGFSRFKHVIEPRFIYTRSTDVDNQREILSFDIVDTPSLPIVQDSVIYSLTHRLIGKEATPNGNAREVLSLSLRQSVALSDPFESAGTQAGEHQFTPLFTNLRFNPYQAITFDAEAVFGNVTHQLDRVGISANLLGTGKHADKYLGFTYFASLERPGQPNSGSSGVRLNAGSFIVRDRIRTDVQLNYDPKDGQFLEQRYLTGWTGSCYGIALEYRRYAVFSSPGDEFLSSYGLAITLKNVGTISTH
ncbi:MAG TPA: LPS assembly protein LptD [Thermoanaerobaculia bacterium]|jgi:LPS-assembly protein